MAFKTPIPADAVDEIRQSFLTRFQWSPAFLRGAGALAMLTWQPHSKVNRLKKAEIPNIKRQLRWQAMSTHPGMIKPWLYTKQLLGASSKMRQRMQEDGLGLYALGVKSANIKKWHVHTGGRKCVISPELLFAAEGIMPGALDQSLKLQLDTLPLVPCEMAVELAEVTILALMGKVIIAATTEEYR
jgi:hypothetical protein